jgi:hypothetical protein
MATHGDRKWDVIPQLEVLAALEGQLALGLALDALQSQDNLLGGLGLLVEDGLGLTTITGLLAVVTALSLSEQRGLAGLVLGDLVLGVLSALLALAVGVSGLGDVDLVMPSSQPPWSSPSAPHVCRCFLIDPDRCFVASIPRVSKSMFAHAEIFGCKAL